MENHTHSARRGAILVFVLMALIALLALAVVFLSRAGRDADEPAPTATQAAQSPAAAGDAASGELATTGSEDLHSEIPEETPVPQHTPPPPPPTPIPTADTKSLPPEG